MSQVGLKKTKPTDLRKMDCLCCGQLRCNNPLRKSTKGQILGKHQESLIPELSPPAVSFPEFQENTR